MDVALIPAGISARSYGARRMWARRHTVYGPSGAPAESVERRRAAIRAHLQTHGHPNAQKTHCKRGHALTPANVWLTAGRRQCKACQRFLRVGRPAWVSVGNGQVSIAAHDAFYLRRVRRLRARMIATHPDKGGTSHKFWRARTAWERFQATEASWYAAYGLTPPNQKRERSSHDSSVRTRPAVRADRGERAGAGEYGASL